MTIGRKYACWAVGGMVFWAAIFYYVGYQLLGWPPVPLGIAYASLIGLLSIGQFALYRSENIVSYNLRMRRRMQIAGALELAIWLGLLVWLVAAHLMSWQLALIVFIFMVLLGSFLLWAVYHTMVRFRLGSRPGDDGNG
jgi:hypothetical protein